MKVKNNKDEKKVKKEKCKTTKDNFLRAVKLIKNKDVKTSPLDSVFNRKVKRKVLNLCSHDSTIPNLRRPNSEVLPTNTQLLLSQLRKCTSEHNWSAAARCVYYMLDMNGKLLPVIWKSIIVILFNHPKVNAQNINDFLQMGLALRTYEEKSKFLLQLLSLPNDIRMFSCKIKRSGVKSEGTQEDEHIVEEFL
ncbi:uncharacterized protein [Rhodnius prolixus]|uniref:Uncharacterized protein n=2 Tax=Rhodnius TaxID=13248 RepID=T1I050_RHOPR